MLGGVRRLRNFVTWIHISPTKLLKHVLISALVATSVVLAGPLKLGKRSITENQFDSPCFTLNAEGPAVSKPLSESIADLKDRTAGLISDAIELKDYIKTKYSFDDMTSGYLDMQNWMDEEKMIPTEEQKEAAIAEPIEALKAHFLLLVENVKYINQTRTVGPIGEKSNEYATRRNLQDFEVKLYSCMCSIKIALLSGGNDVSNTVGDDIFNSVFLSFSSPLENATYRAYVTIQDSLELIEFLNTIYGEIQRSMDDTEA